MSLKIIKAADPMPVERLNICIYGPPGVGKTTLAFTAADPLLFDTDRGSYRASNRKDTVPVSSWNDIVSMTGDELKPYKTLVLDTAGRALDFLTTDIIAENPKLGRGGALTLQGYGTLKARFAAWLKMVRSFGKDVVLIAHMDEQHSGDAIVERLDVQGGSKGEIYKSVDAMGRIFVKGKERIIDFSPRENAFGKNPCNLELIPFLNNEPKLLGVMIGLMKERMNHISEDQKGAKDAVNDWAVAIADYKTAGEFNQVLEQLRKAPKPIQALAAGKAKSIGLIFDAKAKLYTEPECSPFE
jgi:hypothetical protein